MSAPADAAGRGGGESAGSIEEGLKRGLPQAQATYTVAYIAHMPLEPRAAVADGQTASSPSGPARNVPSASAPNWPDAFGIPEESIRVIVPDTGAGYGGKHTGEAAIEAARLAKAAGKPVKLVWTRRRRIHLGLFPPRRRHRRLQRRPRRWHDHRLGIPQLQLRHSGLRCPYDIPNQKAESHPPTPLCAKAPIAPWPPPPTISPASPTSTNWPTPLKMDPLDFRLKNLKRPAPARRPRSRRRRLRLARRQGAATGAAFGLAVGTEKGSYLATCAEVLADKDSGTVKVAPRRQRLRLRRGRQPQSSEEPGGRRDGHGPGRRAFRGHRI